MQQRRDHLCLGAVALDHQAGDGQQMAHVRDLTALAPLVAVQVGGVGQRLAEPRRQTAGCVVVVQVSSSSKQHAVSRSKKDHATVVRQLGLAVAQAGKSGPVATRTDPGWAGSR